MQQHLGLDIAKLKFDCALLVGQRVLKQSFPNNPAGFRQLLDWLAKHAVSTPDTHACLEATGTYGDALARWLYQHAFRVSVVNPARIRFFAQSLLTRNKTDALDAEMIARFCQQQQPKPWTPPSPAQEQLQALTRLSADLTAQRQDNRNRLESATLPAVVKCLKQLDRQLSKHLANVRKLIQQHLQGDDQLGKQNQLLQTIPGIGQATAATVLAELPQHLSSARQAAAYAGLTPRQKLSGSSVRGRSALSKTGNGSLRKALFFPALTALKYNPLIQALAKRLLAKGKSKMCVVGAAMRKLLHLIYGVLKHLKPFDPNWQPNPSLNPSLAPAASLQLAARGAP
jgi:transposase